MKAPSTEQSKGIITLVGGIVLLVLLVIVFKNFGKIFRSITDGLGVTDSKDEEEDREDIEVYVDHQQSLGINSVWSPVFYKSAPAGTIILTAAGVAIIVKNLWDSVGYVYDSPSIGAAAIKSIPNGVSLSYVCEQMKAKYSVDLLTWLQNKYDTAEQVEYLADIIRYVKGIPKY